jgi:hypothetical protein
MPTKVDFQIRLSGQADIPAPVTKALGTGTSATLTHLSLNLPYSVSEQTVKVAAPQQGVPQGSR